MFEPALALTTLPFAVGAVATLAYRAWLTARHPRRGTLLRFGAAEAHVVREGAGSPVVLVHGMAASLDNFPAAVRDGLAQSWSVVALDRPGHGHSGRVRGTRAGFDENVALARGVAKLLGAERPIVVGHSYGAAVALRWALDAPDEVSGLVLVAPLGCADANAARWRQLPLEAWPLMPLVAHTLAVPVGLVIARQVRAQAWHPQRPPLSGGASRAQALHPKSLLASAAEMHRMHDDFAALSARLGEVRVPVAIIGGSEDRVTPPAKHAAPLAAAIPGATFEVVDGVGHQLQHVRPERIVAAVEAVGRRRDERRGPH